jgi:hypothetical protein
MNSTFWCASSTTSCYSFTSTLATYATAASSCADRGGFLVVYNTGAEQWMVESNIRALGNTVPADYWWA